MKTGPLDWRTLRLCEPEQARLLVRALAVGLPFFVVVSVLGSALHTLALPLLLIFLYLVAVGTLALRLFASAKETLARLDPNRAVTRGKPAWATEEMRRERLERKMTLALAAVDRFRAHYRSPLTLLGVIGFGVVLGFVGWSFISAVGGASSNSPQPPASFVEGTPVSRTFTVESTAASAARGGTGMLDTGIVLRGGASVSIEATGSMSCVNVYSWCTVGPAGDSGFRTTRAQEFPLPGAPAWGLIAQAGTGPILFIGPRATISGTGRLALGVNDNYPYDNLGSFDVVVTYSCAFVTVAAQAGVTDPCTVEP